MDDAENGKKREKSVQIVSNDKTEKGKTKEKVILSPSTCDTTSVSSVMADEKPLYSSDPNTVVELRQKDPTGRMPRTGDQREPVPGYSAGGTSMEDLVRPIELLNSSMV